MNNHKPKKDFWNRKRKGQMEVFGLAFIVILISIGFFIYVGYRSQKTTENPQKEFSNDKLANDFVLSAVKTTVEGCDGFSVEDLIIDCARDKRITCGSGESSCIALNNTLTILLKKTFEERNIAYRFNSQNLLLPDGTTELIDVSSMGCTGNSNQGQSGSSVTPLYPLSRSVFLRLNICY